MQLFNILLSLVDEQQLGWDGGDVFVCRSDGCLVLIGLDGQVPQGELVVGARGGKDGSVGGVPFDGCYRGGMPLELSDGGWCAKRGASDGANKMNKKKKKTHSLNILKSQTFKPPSSPPETNK